MSAEIVIAEWQKNSREILRVRLDTFKDQPVICCRSWYRNGDGIMKPGGSGLTISARHEHSP
jgi:Transcriptional Coactivator p15 (PC4)